MTARGWVALLLAFGIAASAIIICIETILHVGPATAEEATVLSTVLGASVGAVATYLGGHLPTPPEPPPPDQKDDVAPP